VQKSRLEAFSDGVLAIVLTIMVLELKVPHGARLADLLPLLPVFLSYVLSFIYVGIYWNNHHHLFQAAKHVNGQVLWANLHLLFWLSLTPFITAWAGENDFAEWPMALYGFVLLMSGMAYFILSQTLIRLHGKDSVLANAVGRDRKGQLSLVCYLTAIGLAFWQPLLSGLIYVGVAILWIVPDKRIANALQTPK